MGVLGFTGAPLWLWTLGGAAVLWGLGAPTWVWVVCGLLALLLNGRPIRRRLLSAPLMALLRTGRFLPPISETERTVLEAGSVWIEGELFSGKPDFKRLLGEPYPDLTEEEQAFLDGPVEELCRLVDDWTVYAQKDLPPEVWEYLRQKRFFGMIIPKEYGGLGFSASANSAVVGKLGSRSLPLSFMAMVPNSLGPAELLMHYGTEAQKRHYLPRLARGEEIPCFALTEPGAGSDAGSIRASGVLFKGGDGRLYLRLNWKKRYITLAGISTVLGLAFKLRDPERLLGKGENPGITCALIPSDTPGVMLGRRHDPMGMPFVNGPTEGQDVVVPIDCIIGGAAGAGVAGGCSSNAWPPAAASRSRRRPRPGPSSWLASLAPMPPSGSSSAARLARSRASRSRWPASVGSPTCWRRLGVTHAALWIGGSSPPWRRR